MFQIGTVENNMTTETEKLEIIVVLKECAFALESVAHLQGKERELLPIVKKVRGLIHKITPKPEPRYCRDCGRKLDWMGYCPKCDSDMAD